MKRESIADLVALFVWLLLCFSAAGIGGMFNSYGLGQWYDTLVKPAGTPPSWVFGPVWTVLYVMMAVAAWLIWRQRQLPGARMALSLFVIHLVLNAAWSGLFFALQRLDLALVGIVLLWGMILSLIILFKPLDLRASVLMVPYLLWVSYATYLNAAFWWLNG